MATLTFDVTAFRAQFPVFSDPIAYPDAVLQMYWDNATCYISCEDYGFLTGTCRQLALNLMTAHLAQIATNANNGQSTGQRTSAGIGRVSVSITPPTNKTQYSYWLNTTPYGAQLEALLSANIAGGWLIGGLPETSAIRKVGGIF